MDHSEVKHLKVDHTPAELDEASRLLLKAADLIEQRGHAKNMRCDSKGAYCYYGALSTAHSGTPYGSYSDNFPMEHPFNQADGRMWAALGIRDCVAVVNWNNAPERTKDEVVAKLRAVALGL